MNRLLVITVALGSFAAGQGAQAATGTLMEVSGIDVSGTTEDIWYYSGGRYTLLSTVSVNTTVAYAPYAYTTVFYLPSGVPPSSVVVTNQASTVQAGYTIRQVTPVGTPYPGSGTAAAPTGDVGGTLMSVIGTDVGGTTEYVWTHVAGIYSLLGSSVVNTAAAYKPFGYNALFYLPSSIAPADIVVTNQASAIQTSFAEKTDIPFGVPVAASPAVLAPAATPATSITSRGGQLLRAHGTDVSGTTEYVWYHVNGTYGLLGSGPVDATGAHTAYSYNVLFFLPTGEYNRNVVVSNQAGTFQHGFAIDGKLPPIVTATVPGG